MASVERHGRLGAPKSTTGCITCKKRKVKCDEAKPVCVRCTKAGRECLGYAIWQARQYRSQGQVAESPPNGSPAYSILNIHQSEDEYKFFQFFTTQASQTIAGVFEEDFWSRTLPQMSSSNPAVRYGILAVSSLFRARCTNTLVSLSEAPYSLDRDGFALRYYNKSLKETLMSSLTPDHLETALVTCVLFFCVEALQRRLEDALALYYHGQILLNKAANSSAFNNNHLRQIFSRLRVLAALFGERRPECFIHSTESQCDGSLNELGVFSTLTHARSSLHDLITDCHRFIERAYRQKWLAHETPEIEQALDWDQIKLKARLQTWRDRFNNLSQLSCRSDAAESSSISDPSAEYTSMILQCHQKIMFIWLSCVVSKSECSYDAYYQSFQEVVSLASRCIELTNQRFNGARPHFQFDQAVIPPLYMVASRCRDPQLRRRAIDLLHKAPFQESLWDGAAMATLAEVWVEIEEQGLVPGQWPAEEARVHDALSRVQLDENTHSNRHTCVFMRKPYGLDGEWESWTKLFS